MKLHELREARARKVAELRQINDAANGAELSAEQRTRFDTLETECHSLGERIAREERTAELERHAAATPINENAAPSDFDQLSGRVSLLRAMRIATGVELRDGAEAEWSAENERRTGRKAQGIFVPNTVTRISRQEVRVMTTGAAGAGLTFTEHRPQDYVDALLANLVTGARGATVLSGLQGNVSIPKNDSTQQAQWIAENSALSGGDGDFNSVTLAPKTVGMLGEVTRNLMLQSDPSVEALVRADFGKRLAVALDAAALVGGGSNQPSGIIDRLTDASALGTLSDASWEQVLAMIAGIELANAATGSLGWAVNPHAMKTLRAKPKVVYGSPEVRDAGAGFVANGPNEVAGYAASSTTSMPGSGSPAAGSAIFGDWASLLIGYWSGIDLLANPYATGSYEKGNVQIRALLTADVAVRHLESFAAAIDIPA